jgi:hypothetical protein
MIPAAGKLPNSAIPMDAWLHPIICSLVSTQAQRKRNGTARHGTARLSNGPACMGPHQLVNQRTAGGRAGQGREFLCWTLLLAGQVIAAQRIFFVRLTCSRAAGQGKGRAGKFFVGGSWVGTREGRGGGYYKNTRVLCY